MKIPDKVTDEQLEIIKATEGYIRVASVPGSGKTFVLTYRIAYLITELYVDPASIVALTFTNKAAGAASVCSEWQVRESVRGGR